MAERRPGVAFIHHNLRSHLSGCKAWHSSGRSLGCDPLVSKQMGVGADVQRGQMMWGSACCQQPLHSAWQEQELQEGGGRMGYLCVKG